MDINSKAFMLHTSEYTNTLKHLTYKCNNQQAIIKSCTKHPNCTQNIIHLQLLGGWYTPNFLKLTPCFALIQVATSFVNSFNNQEGKLDIEL